MLDSFFFIPMIDILISFDTTGSMYPALSEVRRKVVDFTTNLFATVTDLRIGVLTHGDYCDGKYGRNVITSHDFTTKQTAVVDFIKNAPPTNGGDYDECYEYVLQCVRKNFQWRPDAKKIAIVIGDAQPHDVGYTYGGVRYVLDWRQQIALLRDFGVTAYAVQCLGRYDSKDFWHSLAHIHGTPLLKLDQFADLRHLLTAVVLQQQDTNLVTQYAESLQGIGELNRNLAAIIDQLTGASFSSRHSSAPKTVSDDSLILVYPGRFQVLHVDYATDITSFVKSSGAVFRKGRGFYELTKAEEVQERKEVILQDKRSGDFYTGAVARDMIKLPYGMRGRVYPYNAPHGYRVFVQSTSNNRKLMAGTTFLYDTHGII